MRSVIFLTLFFFTINLAAQDAAHVMNVHFFYGSKPKFKYRKTEHKEFGGLHGGHVSMEVEDTILGFQYKGKVHIFPHRHDCHSIYVTDLKHIWVKDTIGKKYISFEVPLTDLQYLKFKSISRQYIAVTPYDYAFFGMRCASSTYDIFAQLGFWKQRTWLGSVVDVFYPKILRKRFHKMAAKNNWKTTKHPGNPRRKWERK